MFRAMRKIWLMAGAGLVLISSLAGAWTERAGAAGSYNEADCKNYYEGKRADDGTSCEEIKKQYEIYGNARMNRNETQVRQIWNSKIKNKISLNDYEKIVELYQKIAANKSIDDSDVENCKKYLYDGGAGAAYCSSLQNCLSKKSTVANCESVKKQINAKKEVKPTPGEGGGSGGEGELDNYGLCLQNGGMLGWVVCPLLSAATAAIEWGYEKIEDQFAISPELVSTDSSKPTYKVWAKFRDFGNIIFVILILVIIFSQLTGIGISNYGIKKMLPKIIVVAILVNVSYYLAQLLVDVSNIIGYSAKTFLSSQAALTNSVGNISTTGVGKLVSGLVGAIVVVGLGLIFLSLPIFGAALISMLTMLALLALRQSLAIMLVVLSPLALACFLLPNTKKIFDKYWAVAKAVLLAFPIAGVMIGAGQLAGALTVASSDSTMMAIMGFLMQVMPFLAVPMLLKKSLDGLGGIGSKISNFGNNKAKNRLRKAGEISKERRQRLGAAIWTKAGPNGNVSLRKGSAWLSDVANKNRVGRFVLGRTVREANKGAAAANAQTAQNDQYLNQDFVNKQMTEAGVKVRASLDENVLRDQIQNAANQAEITINRARMRQNNQDVYEQERRDANIGIANDRYKIEQIAEAPGKYFTAKFKEQRAEIDKEISNKTVLADSPWILKNRANKAELKTQGEATSAAVDMIAAGNFTFDGETYNAGDVAALERLARKTAMIIGADGKPIQKGNSAVFKAVIQTLASRGKSSDFEAIERIVKGQELAADGSTVGYLGGATNRLGNDTMMAYSSVIASNSDNKSKYKTMYDQAMAIENNGSYDAEKHAWSKFEAQDLDKYDAYVLGGQKVPSLERIIERVNSLKTNTDEKSIKELTQLRSAIIQAKRNERISDKWDGDQRDKINKLLTAVEQTEAIKVSGATTATGGSGRPGAPIKNNTIDTPKVERPDGTREMSSGDDINLR